jgi:hypothetical protein
VARNLQSTRPLDHVEWLMIPLQTRSSTLSPLEFLVESLIRFKLFPWIKFFCCLGYIIWSASRNLLRVRSPSKPSKGAGRIVSNNFSKFHHNLFKSAVATKSRECEQYLHIVHRYLIVKFI